MIGLYSQLTDSIVEVSIERGDSVITLQEVRPGLHRLGFASHPGFEIRRDPSPDEPWEIEVREPIVLPAASAPLPDTIRGWLPADRVDATSALLAHVPDGSYYLVLARAPAPEPEPVLLGNEWVRDADAHHQKLFDSRDAYAGLIGHRPGRRPHLGDPLLGVSVLNFTGDPSPYAALFFSCVAGAGPESPERVVLLVPRTGPLVFDAMEEYSAEHSARDRERWADELAERYAKAIAASPEA